MLWFSPNKFWSIGGRENLGTGISAVHSSERDLPLPEAIIGPWNIPDRNNENWLTTNNIKVVALPPAPPPPPEDVEDDVAASTKTIDVNAWDIQGTPSKSKAPTEAKAPLWRRVAKARALCDEASEAKYRELIKPTFDAYAADEIHEDELKRAKVVARDEATTEVDALSALDKEYAGLTAATEARVEAEKLLGAAIKAEAEASDAESKAADKVEKALKIIEQRVKGA